MAILLGLTHDNRPRGYACSCVIVMAIEGAIRYALLPIAISKLIWSDWPMGWIIQIDRPPYPPTAHIQAPANGLADHSDNTSISGIGCPSASMLADIGSIFAYRHLGMEENEKQVIASNWIQTNSTITGFAPDVQVIFMAFLNSIDNQITLIH
ncbi:hypothetical protein BDZ91DRAFT_768136 [Kalaharituber pfeilii]|nr:hypothetical protein BDZ91DRAFT_768136 [Kalaharituber pfeilii]